MKSEWKIISDMIVMYNTRQHVWRLYRKGKLYAIFPEKNNAEEFVRDMQRLAKTKKTIDTKQ